jgi:hypothetical protein
MNEALSDLIGQRVEIWDEGNNFRDRGTLVAFDDPWVRIESAEGDVLCFPVYNVRLVKRIGPGDTHVAP